MQIDIQVNKSGHTCNCPLPPLVSSLRKIPDLCIYDRNDKTRILLQLEVDSGDLNKTLRKLALSLIDQLRYDSITTCIGFYFPNNSSCTSVIKVTLMWSDETTDFTTTNSTVPRGNFIREIKTAIQLEKKTKPLLIYNKQDKSILHSHRRNRLWSKCFGRQSTMSFWIFSSYP